MFSFLLFIHPGVEFLFCKVALHLTFLETGVTVLGHALWLSPVRTYYSTLHWEVQASFFFTSFLDIFLLTIFYYEVEFYIYFSPRGFLCTLFSELFQTWACLPIALTLKKKKNNLGWIHIFFLYSVVLYLLVLNVAVESSGSNWLSTL